ncbi:MAG: DUF2835 domain-containing protein [Gammaproteobacteria bacterium]
MRRYAFRLDISADNLLRYYRGQAGTVSVRSFDGTRLSFPAQRLRPHARHDGVHGRFELTADKDGRFVDLVRVSV